MRKQLLKNSKKKWFITSTLPGHAVPNLTLVIKDSRNYPCADTNGHF